MGEGGEEKGGGCEGGGGGSEEGMVSRVFFTSGSTVSGYFPP